MLVTKYPLDVLNHSILHGHVDLADRAARESLTQSLNDVAIKLTAPGLLPRFVLILFQFSIHNLMRILDNILQQMDLVVKNG